jgi:hypothetical protein
MSGKNNRPRSPRNIKKKYVDPGCKPNINIIEQEVPITIMNKTLNDDLFKYEYEPLSLISIKNNQNISKTCYVKAINNMSQTVYILLDTDNIDNLKSDMTLIESKTNNLLPYSLKSGAVKLAGFDVAGVAFECDKKGLCVLLNVIEEDAENISIVEYNYIFEEIKKPEMYINQDNFYCNISYPVIKMSEIKMNNTMVIDGTDIVIKKLRSNSYNIYNEDLNMLKNSIHTLNLAYEDFINIINDNAYMLKNSMAKLDTWNKHYRDYKPDNDLDNQKFNQIKYNMRLRNDYNIYMLNAMGKISEQKNIIDKISNIMIEYTDFFEHQLNILEDQ